MHLNLITKRVSFFVIAWVAISSAYAVPPGPCDPKPIQDPCCEPAEPGPFAFSFPRDTNLACPRDFYVFGDLLVLQAKQDGMDYAKQDVGDGSLGTFPLQGGKIFGFSENGHDWGWNLGFRVGVGFELNHDQWSIDAAWTYVRIKEDHSTGVQAGVLLPLWLPPGVTPSLGNTVASARWKGRFNTLDFSLAKPHHISRYVIFSPFFGIRTAWFEQNLQARYGGILNGSVDGTNMFSKNNYWGVGTRAGLNTEWILGNGWLLFGRAAASILYGKFDISQNAAVSTSTYAEKEEFFSNVPNFELTLGISWGTYFDKDRYLFNIQAAYEFHDWWNQNQLRRFYDSSTPSSNDVVANGDFTLNGFSFRLRLEF